MTSVVASTGIVGGAPFLALVDGQPAMSYADDNTLTYAVFDGTSWQREIVVRDVFVGEYTSLAVVTGYPAISYYDFGAETLKYAQFNGITWLIIVVDSGFLDGQISLVEVANQPAIRYHAAYYQSIKYARFRPPQVTIRAYLPMISSELKN